MYPIASVTIGSNGSYCDFSNIPQTFTHLQLRVFGRGMTSFSPGLSLYVAFNSDGTAANYVVHGLQGDGAAVATFSATNAGSIGVQNVLADSSATSGVFGLAISDILDYTSTSKHKTVRTLAGFDRNGGGRAALYSGLWMPSPIAAINKITVNTDGGFLAGSRFDLYGIRSTVV